MRGLPFAFPGSSAFPPPSYLNVHLGGLKKCGRKSRRQNRGEKTKQRREDKTEETRHRRERHMERRQNIREKTLGEKTKHRREDTGTWRELREDKMGDKT